MCSRKISQHIQQNRSSLANQGVLERGPAVYVGAPEAGPSGMGQGGVGGDDADEAGARSTIGVSGGPPWLGVWGAWCGVAWGR